MDRGEPDVDKKYRLGINYLTKQGHCFRCDWASRDNSVNEFLDRKTPLLLLRAGWIDKEDSGPIQVKEPPPKIVLPEDFTLLHQVTDQYDRLAWQAHVYLKDRGISKACMRAKQIGVSFCGRYSYRIIFPVYWLGRLKGIVARDFTKQALAKYLNSPGEKYLYNLPDTATDIILSEGVFKALAIEAATGLPSAALLGHSLTEIMLKQLRYTMKSFHKLSITIWPDPDSVGRKGAIEVAKQLTDNFTMAKIYLVSPVPDKQADELSAGEIRDRYKARVPYSWALANSSKAIAAFGR